MIRGRLFNLFYLIFFVSIYTFGQDNYYSQYSIGPDEGLSNATVRKIIKDHSGMIWIGTMYGLNLYDGKNITVLKNIDNLGNVIFDMAPEGSDRLWIASYDNGLGYFDYKTNRFFSFSNLCDSAEAVQFVSGNIASVYIDRFKNMWVGTYLGLLRYNLESGSILLIDNRHPNIKFPSYEITSIEEDQSGNMYFGTKNGLIIYARHNNKFDAVNLSSISKNPQSNEITDIKCNKTDNTMWIGTKGGGLFMYNPDIQHTEQVDLVDHNEIIWSLESDQNNLLWVGIQFELKAFNLSDNKQIDLQKYNIDEDTRSKIYNKIYIDNQGYIWMSSFNSGITLLDPYASKINWYYSTTENQYALQNNVITSIAVGQNGKTIIGTRGGWLSIYDTLNGIKSYDIVRKAGYMGDILSIYQDDNGDIYSGTYLNGINKSNLNHNTWKFDQPDKSTGKWKEDSDIRAITRRDKQSLWIGTNRSGLYSYNPDNGLFKLYDPWGHTGALKIIKDRNGYLWIASYYGLKLVNPDNPEDHHLFIYDKNNPFSISNDVISDILISDKEDIWVSTQGGGINRYNRKDSTFTRYTEKNGLANNHVVSMVEDREGALWIGTGNGLSRFDPETETFRNYYIQDGLPTNTFTIRTAGLLSDGTIIMGTNEGIIHLNPKTLKKKDPPANLLITEIKVYSPKRMEGDNPLRHFAAQTSALELKYDESTFSIYYSNLTYSKIVNTNFRYRLYPLQKDWIDVGNNREATFTKIPPGKYTFELSTSLNGKEIKEIKTLSIIILPPWWNTWWFRISATIFLSAFGFFIYKYRVIHVKNENKRLEKVVSQRTEELISINDDLINSRVEIQKQNEAISKQNEKLQNQNREIIQQRNNFEQQKILLEITRNELFSLNQSLEEKVNERTKKLAKANLALDRFVYSASHELVAPLKSIKGLLHVMNRDPEESNRKYYESLLSDSVDKLEHLVLNLLDFSRNQKSRIEIENFNLSGMIEDIFSQHAFHSNNVKLINLIGNDVEVATDQKRIKIILNNLISNAIKYQDYNKTANYVEVSHVLNGKYHIIKISDNGEGIDQEYVPRLFEMYFRGSTKSQGSGLGLYISKEIAKKIMAEISVSSNAGIGSEFTLKIPKEYQRTDNSL